MVSKKYFPIPVCYSGCQTFIHAKLLYQKIVSEVSGTSYNVKALARQHYHFTCGHFKTKIKSKLNNGIRTYDIRCFRPRWINVYLKNKSLTIAEEHRHHAAAQSYQMLSRHWHFHVACHISCTKGIYCIMLQMAQLITVRITFIKISWNAYY